METEMCEDAVLDATVVVLKRLDAIDLALERIERALVHLEHRSVEILEAVEESDVVGY